VRPADLPPVGAKAVHNERLKLTANILNTVAGAMVTIGLVTPLTAYALDVQGLRSGGLAPVLLLGAAWLAAGTLLHWAARKSLGDLR
jgi:hypothetical protein